MYTLEKFYNDIRLFSNSLVIKVYEVAVTMQLKAEPTKDPALTDKSEWKYFLNLNGQYHHTDPEVYINVIELEETRLLTRELLEEFPVTKDELLKSEDYYYNLVNAYQDMFIFIHGCLYPVEIDKAIKAPNGTILNYNSTFLEQQEYSLVRELENFTIDFIERWMVKGYIVSDELYLPTILGVLYANIPNKVASIRASKIRTKEAHSFFMQVYFESNFGMWDALQVLNEKSLRWLYLNMDYLIKNLGKNITFQTIIEKILSANSVGIGSYHIHGQDQSLTSDYYNVKELPFSQKQSIIIGHKLNSAYIANNNSTSSISDVLQRELDAINFYNPEHESYIIKNEVEHINKGSKGEEITKVLEISTLREFNAFNTDVFRVLFDYWGYMLHYGYYGSFTDDKRSTAKVEFVDPNTSKHYNISSKVGYYFAIKILLKAVNKVDAPVKDIIYSTVLDPDANIREILEDQLYQDGYTAFLHPYIKTNYPSSKQIYTSYIDVGEFLGKVNEFYKNMWLLNANSENSIVGSNLRNFLYRASLQERVPIHDNQLPLTIDELIDREGYTFTVPKDYDPVSAMKELFRVCLGYEVNADLKLSKFLDSFKTVIKKLTSYTLQVTGGVENISNYYCYYNTIRPLLMDKGIVKMDPDCLTGIPYDTTLFYSTFLATVNDEEIKRDVFIDKPIFDYATKNYIKGIVEVNRDVLEDPNNIERIDRILPSAQISLITLPAKQMDKVKLEDNFITINKIFRVEDNRKFTTAIFEDDTNVWADVLDPEQRIEFTIPETDKTTEGLVEVEQPIKAGDLDTDEITIDIRSSDIVIKPK